jgi:hypothetical protein
MNESIVSKLKRIISILKENPVDDAMKKTKIAAVNQKRVELKAAEDGLKAANDRLIELSRTQVTPTNSVDLAKQIKDARDSVKSAKEKVKQAKAFLAAAQKELSAVSTSSI